MAQTPREWFEKDYYKVLGVSDTATEKEITRAYRKLAKKFHPDANPGDPKSESRFKEVSTAYDVLGDGSKRKEYDELRKLGPLGMGGRFGGPGSGGGGFSSGGPSSGSGGPGSGSGPGGFAGNVRVEDLGDLLGGIFGRARGGRGSGGDSGRAANAPQRGEDLEAVLHLSFEESIAGATTSVNITSEVACATCHGTGAAPGTSPVICSVCSGRGVLDDNQGFFAFSQPCRACGGTGMRIETPCPTCSGSGLERRPRQVRVRVPPGVADGQRIRLKARGGAGFNGGPTGDLYVVVQVAPHELFGRRGKDLTLTVPITFPEAALGATVTVPTLEQPVTLKIPPGTPSGRTFRVKGKGAPSGSSSGDLLVTVEVSVPNRLSEDERSAIEKLAAAATDSPRRYPGM